METLTPNEIELKKLQAERNRLYWLFTRCANAKPVPATLMRRLCALEDIVRKEREAKKEVTP